MKIIKEETKNALFVGSFTYFKMGHFDVVKRALKVFDYVYIAPSINEEKNNENSLEERYLKLKNKFKNFKRIEIIKNTGDSSSLAKKLNASIVRGVRIDDENIFIRDSLYEKKLIQYYEEHGVECFVVYNKSNSEEFFPENYQIDY
ncbi:adenylyltransferase/cytidyltransferase family protein [[Mycoplasma] mobile]|uniref:Phosphopantetheine adenylyltransferase n=1 Tax=Mycoplasma mobile (strain ATCC 43663 / 163K / NCTC 11711) TaxID=267748 RepID=Q6KH68_MYCM1|nr:adenylyltransferase/cytidyltransferase family protein [[Mycoplasma] mobile]AAT28062.1 putative phosphopantetheine adenylyltransferase [Mycoplasma mobile 163K]